eukprot:1613013-Ditylum_brightwellii.AAC.1
MSIILDLGLQEKLLPKAIPVLTDNISCVCWSKGSTSKGIRHIQIRENAIRESVCGKLITISYCQGKTNIVDFFKKEERDQHHFISIPNLITCEILNT